MYLRFANRNAYFIIPGDAQANAIVAVLGTIMRLKPVSNLARPFIVLTDRNTEEGFALVLPSRDVLPNEMRAPLIYNLRNFTGRRPRRIHGAHALALIIVREAHRHAGILLHGALAEFAGSGVILMGPSGVGKSTASDRLPSAWRSLSDDATLIVSDSQGCYWAHPWPTWSRFYDSEGIDSWDVEYAVPLRAIFMLTQSPADRVEPVINRSHSMSLLMESAEQVIQWGKFESEESKILIRRERLAAVRQLSSVVPVHLLHISLTGTFWEEIESVLPSDPHPPDATQMNAKPVVASPNTARLLDNLPEYVVLIGSSMLPMLHESDVLEIQPYEDRKIRRGDVIYFLHPERNHGIVHRVTHVTQQGISTRGDSSTEDDPYLSRPEHIKGYVAIAHRGPRQWKVLGGWRGCLLRDATRVRQQLIRYSGKVLHHAYSTLSKSGICHSLLPRAFRPRTIVFSTTRRSFYKLMVGNKVVGYYDPIRQQWIIHPPFRLFVDETTLPF